MHTDEVLSLGRGLALPTTAFVPVHEYVAEFARDRPESAAVRCGDRSLDYRGLDAWAGRIAERLAATGVGPGDHVGVLTEPSMAMVAAVLGILRAGAAYVPVDLAQPDARIAEMLADARVAGVVVSHAAQTHLVGSGLNLIRAGDPAPSSRRPPMVQVGEGDPAYVIYTSGSTGEPKGVLVEHAQLAASTLARRIVYSDVPVFLLVSPLAFDSSVAGIWGTLTTGGCLVIATTDEIRDPERLVGLVDRHGVTHMLCVPSLYAVVLDAAERLGRSRLRTLQEVIVAGESLPEALLRRHFALHGAGVTLVNEYGPTEATVWASYRRYESPGPVSIGGPIPGARLYVLDDDRRPVPAGVPGELYIGGPGVARGYVGRPDATQARFVTDPYAMRAGSRMYRTGDLVRYNDEGLLDFLGRRDHQVKIRGHRVELGAVETAIRALPGVRDAAVLSDAAQTRLTAFVVASDGQSESIRDGLAQRLPAAMIPAQIRMVERFPQTLTGKVDRRALQVLADQSPPVTATAPADDSEGGTAAKVAAAWGQVLQLSDVPFDVNFFDLGGNSLTMYRLCDALEALTGTRPSVVALFRHTTVAAQAALIHNGGGAPDESLAGMREAATRRAQALRARQLRTGREAAT
jgi:amino acid adenylation domain-containing protein